ncbi:MAG: hypothetical protein ACFCUX_04465 [Candidatus Methylacidiphilales bacterium]
MKKRPLPPWVPLAFAVSSAFALIIVVWIIVIWISRQHPLQPLPVTPPEPAVIESAPT